MALDPDVKWCNSGSSLQVDQELATGEFFLRESVKKRKKMEAIKVCNECCCDVFRVRSNVQICSRDKFFNLQFHVSSDS